MHQIERARIKAFYHLLIDRLGMEAWVKRRAAYLERIRAKETAIDISKPIEFQIFTPTEDDIDWYILVAELAHDFPYSDCAYSSKRLYPYIMALGAMVEQIQQIPSVWAVIDRMLANKAKPETQLFELLTASFYLKNGYGVAFVPENSVVWPDEKTRKSPDLLVRIGDLEMYVECKRADKQTRYSCDEEESWTAIWESLSLHLLEVSPWTTVALTFHEQVSAVSYDEVVQVVNEALRSSSKETCSSSVSATTRKIKKSTMRRHYRANAVRPNSPQHELLVFGDVDSNEKRSIATIAKDIIRPGASDDILNIFVDDVSNCVAARWCCDHSISLDRRSRHFKALANNGINQIPPDRPGVVHIWFETVEGIDIEEIRQTKNLDNLSSFDASGTSVLAVFIHGVNYYPFHDRYGWAETVQSFVRIPEVMDLYTHTLMLSNDSAPEFDGITHWQQDKAMRSLD